MKKAIKDFIKHVEGNGYKVGEFVKGGKHIKTTISKGGNSITFPVAGTPGDVHWIKQAQRQIDRHFAMKF